MRDELMYPRAFALMHIKSATDEFYVVSPCYVIKEIKMRLKVTGLVKVVLKSFFQEKS